MFKRRYHKTPELQTQTPDWVVRACLFFATIAAQTLVAHMIKNQLIGLSLLLSTSLAAGQTLPTTTQPTSAAQPTRTTYSFTATTQPAQATPARATPKQPSKILLAVGIPLLVTGLTANAIGAGIVVASGDTITSIFGAVVFSGGVGIDIIGLVPVITYKVKKNKANRATP